MRRVGSRHESTVTRHRAESAEAGSPQPAESATEVAAGPGRPSPPQVPEDRAVLGWRGSCRLPAAFLEVAVSLQLPVRVRRDAVGAGKEAAGEKQPLR